MDIVMRLSARQFRELEYDLLPHERNVDVRLSLGGFPNLVIKVGEFMGKSRRIIFIMDEA